MTDEVTCGTCGKSFPDIYPAARCPFEYEHPDNPMLDIKWIAEFVHAESGDDFGSVTGYIDQVAGTIVDCLTNPRFAGCTVTIKEKA